MRYIIALWMICLSCPLLSQDLALAEPGGAILSPVSGCSLTSTENVRVRIFNFGSSFPAGTSFDVSYTINGGAPITETVVLGSTLLANSAFTYTFITQANLSTPGNYTLTAGVSLPGDINPINNVYTNYIVTNSASSNGGTVSADQTICGVTNSGTLSLSGQTGTISRWETSEDEGTTWRYVSQTTTQQNFLNLDRTTSYRAVVQNGLCPEAISSNATVTITCTLPLKWVSFDAHREESNVVLHWQTTDEINTNYFEIERRADNELFFQPVGKIPARSASPIYSFIDYSPPHITLQYRIKQVDQDGKYSYSSIKRIDVDKEPLQIVFRNNPVTTGILAFDVHSEIMSKATIRIFNADGKIIKLSNSLLKPGSNTVSISMAGASAGIYWMVLQTETGSIKSRFIIR